MSHFCLIEAVEVEGFGDGGVIAAAFGDVQVAGVFDGRDDGGADGGQAGGPAAGAAGGGVFAERRVPYVVMCLDGPVLADQAGQVLRGGVRAGETGDGVDGLAGGPAGSGVLPSAGDLDGLAGVREVQAADVGGLQGPGLRRLRPCPVSRVELPAGTCRQGRALTRACSSGWFFFTTAMYWDFFSPASQSRFARTVQVTTAPARSRGSRSSVKWLVSLCLTSTSR